MTTWRYFENEEKEMEKKLTKIVENDSILVGWTDRGIFSSTAKYCKVFSRTFQISLSQDRVRNEKNSPRYC